MEKYSKDMCKVLSDKKKSQERCLREIDMYSVRKAILVLLKVGERRDDSQKLREKTSV